MKMIQPDEPWKRLSYFDRIIWLDKRSQSQLQAQKEFFKLNYGCQLEHFKEITTAQRFIDKRKDKIFLIVCSSRMINQVIKIFKNYNNCYDRYIVFCGNAHSRDRLITKKQVYTAQYQQCVLIQKIQQLQKLKNDQPRSIWLIQNIRQKLTIYKERQLSSFLNQMEDTSMKIQFFCVSQFANDIKKIDQEGFKIRMILDNRNRKWENNFKHMHQQIKKLKNIKQVYQIVTKNEQNIKYFQSQHQFYGSITYRLVLIQQLKQVHAYIEAQKSLKNLKIHD